MKCAPPAKRGFEKLCIKLYYYLLEAAADLCGEAGAEAVERGLEKMAADGYVLSSGKKQPVNSFDVCFRAAGFTGGKEQRYPSGILHRTYIRGMVCAAVCSPDARRAGEGRWKMKPVIGLAIAQNARVIANKYLVNAPYIRAVEDAGGIPLLLSNR